MNNLEPSRAQWMRVRLVTLAVLLGVGLVRLVAKAHDLQVRQAPDLRAEAQRQYEREIELAPRRGTIYDRHGKPMAVSVDAYSLAVYPRMLAQHVPATTLVPLAARIATALSIPVQDVAGRMQGERFRWIKRQLTPSEETQIKALRTEYHLDDGSGLALVKESRRWYPNRELAAHVVGYVDIDGLGREGVEASFNEDLRGEALRVHGVRDRSGRLVFADGLAPGDGQAGHDVTLTIDLTVQHFAESWLAHTVRMATARGGSVIVTRPDTGEILALANYPTFNPNEPGAAEADARRNRALLDRFEPGSTMKVFTVGGALDAGVIQLDQAVPCMNGLFRIGRHVIHDEHPADALTPMRILQLSSNIGAAQIGLMMGSQGLERVLRRFGFGERTGVELPSESRARFGRNHWGQYEVATVSFGQAIGVTTVQLAQALGAVANGGRLVRPTLLERVRDATGGLVRERTEDAGRTALDPRTARMLAEMLTTVTEDDGTGVNAAIPGIRVAGKTGTAQQALERGAGYDDDHYVASFVGFLPVERPRVLITVVIDWPRPEHRGGIVAAPLFRHIAEETLRYEGLLPITAAPTGSLAAAVTPTELARVRASTEAPQPAPEPLPPGSVTVPVPDVTGRSAREAVRMLHAAGLEARIEGTGLVVQQVPSAGALSTAERPVRLALEPGGGAPHPVGAAAQE